MSESTSPTMPRVGLPDPRTVLKQAMMPAPAPAEAAAAGEPAPLPVSYRIMRTSQTDVYDPVQAPDETELATLEAARPPGDEYRGTSRKAAKITVSHAETEDFTDIAALIESLPPEAEMIEHEPPIGTGASSGRVPKEHRNVRLRGFLYAASREDDNDYHLIVGRHPSKPPMYMTVELSGTPPRESEHFPALKRSRDDFKAFFSGDPDWLPGTSYDFYDPPIEIDITGSVFFDITHATGGRPGPASLRDDMPVIWEIHPISDLVMEP